MARRAPKADAGPPQAPPSDLRPAPGAGAGDAQRTRLRVARLDCPAEELLVAAALRALPGVRRWECDVTRAALEVWHAGAPGPILAALAAVGLPAEVVACEAVAPEAPAAVPAPGGAAAGEARTLRWLLGLNAAMFVVEAVAGWRAESTGLLADALDMFADAAVYGMSLAVVGAAVARQARVARLTGLVQLALALGALAEVGRRAAVGSAPDPPAMMGIALLALAVNATCLLLLARHRHGGAHLRASWIFSTADVLANAGVILAGALVALTGTRWPDLAVGTVIGGLVLGGALRILRLR